MKLESFNEQEFNTFATMATLVAGGISGVYTANLAQTFGSMMLALAATPLLYGILITVRSLIRGE